MNKLTIFVIAVSLTACNLFHDRKNVNDVGKTLVASLVKNDTAKIKELFVHHMDSVDAERRLIINETLKEFKDKNYTYIKTDTSKGLSYLNLDDEPFKLIDSYFRVDTTFYNLKTRFTRDDKGEITIHSFRTIDLTKECSDWQMRPYRPVSNIEFKRLIWNTDYYAKSFKSGKVEVQNKLNSDIEYIKFRVILKHNWSTFFNQTVTSYDKIYAGDIRAIDVPGMSDLFAGFPINSDNIQFNCELIEILPKPESSGCKKIIELKSLKK